MADDTTGEIADLIDDLAADAAGASAHDDDGTAPDDKETEVVAAVERARTVAETEDEEVESDAAPDDEEKPAAKPPEGFANVATITDKLVTEFTVRDTDGDEVEPPALVIEYKANGKVRRDRIDQVVKLAQFGVYNQERETALAAQQEEAAKREDEVYAALETREAQLRRLLEDEETYLAARERYLAENSPEKRAARAEQETRTVREQRDMEQAAVEGERFFEGSVLPTLDELAAEYPEVELEELSAQFTTALMPLMKNGMVPRGQFGRVRQYLDTELRDWAKTKHDRRVAKIAAAREPSEKEAEAARIAAAKAKRATATAARPSARSGTAPSAPARKPVDRMSVDEASDDALASVLAGIKY